jgi:hypothetical protein
MIAIKQVRTQQELEAVIDIQPSVFTEERVFPNRYAWKAMTRRATCLFWMSEGRLPRRA